MAPLWRNFWKKSSGCGLKASKSLVSHWGSLFHYFLSSVFLTVSLLSLTPLLFLFLSSLRLTSLAKVSILGASPLLIRLPADTSSRRALRRLYKSSPPPRWQQRPRIHFGYGAIPRVVGNLRKLAVSCIGANGFTVQIR